MQVVEEERSLRLLAPNRFVVDWVHENCMDQLTKVIGAETDWPEPAIVVEVGRQGLLDEQPPPMTTRAPASHDARWSGAQLNTTYTFQTFVEGKSNQLARAAATQVAWNPGSAYNRCMVSSAEGIANFWQAMTG